MRSQKMSRPLLPSLGFNWWPLIMLLSREKAKILIFKSKLNLTTQFSATHQERRATRKVLSSHTRTLCGRALNPLRSSPWHRTRATSATYHTLTHLSKQCATWRWCLDLKLDTTLEILSIYFLIAKLWSLPSSHQFLESSTSCMALSKASQMYLWSAKLWRGARSATSSQPPRQLTQTFWDFWKILSNVPCLRFMVLLSVLAELQIVKRKTL